MLSTAVVERFDGQPQPEAPMPGLTRLRLAGPITAATSAGAREALLESARRSDFRLLVDLHDVTALDASGVAALLEGRRQIDGHEQGVMVLRANEIVIRALKESGTMAAFKVWKG
ncbi:MAG TPA: STAS domain-containing protein [Methylomirabilota bacterium]|nr:STAS domain-containing protein [Methylomirabilota bacterium]